MRVRRWRFAAIYLACWLPYGVIYTLVLLIQRPSTPFGSAVVAGAWALANVSILGLGARAAVHWIHRRNASQATTLLLAAATAVGFGILNSALTIAGIRVGAPPSVFREFMADAFGWDLIGGIAIGALVVAIFMLIEVNERLMHQRALALRADELRVRAEFDALRAQLDPHFLFNTLHSITALVRRDPALAERALERFGSLMRYVLDSANERQEEVSLDEELAFVRSYVALETLRLGDRLRVVEEIDDEALDCGVPPLTLQPLVENAIRHGIAPRAAGGTLRLAASVAHDVLLITVADDGAGGVPSRAGQAGGIGLRVVQQRLTARYGTASRCDVVAAPNEGWAVHLRVPAQPALMRQPPLEITSRR